MLPKAFPTSLCEIILRIETAFFQENVAPKNGVLEYFL